MALEWGRFQVAPIDAGRLWLDGGAMFGVVPRPLWERDFPPDELNRVELAQRLLLVVDNRPSCPRRILVDTGMGEHWSVRERERLKVDNRLEEGLHAANLSVNDITDVVLTHLHFDHAGGATREREGQIVPLFPRATYHLQRRALKWAQHPTERDQRSFRMEAVSALCDSGQVHLLDGPCELFEGFSLVVSEGHSVGMQLPLIEGGHQGKLLFCADLIPTRAHVQLSWVMAYDLYPLTTLEEKRLLLAQALEERWVLFFEHDPKVAAVRLTESGGAAALGEQVIF